METKRIKTSKVYIKLISMMVLIALEDAGSANNKRVKYIKTRYRSSQKTQKLLSHSTDIYEIRMVMEVPSSVFLI